jgi:hypothetical protein
MKTTRAISGRSASCHERAPKLNGLQQKEAYFFSASASASASSLQAAVDSSRESRRLGRGCKVASTLNKPET